MSKFKNNHFISSKILSHNYGDIILTHAVPTQKIFFSILKDGIIKKPSDHIIKNNYQLLTKIFNIHDCVYFSGGWEYNSTFHHWPFAFIFNKSILKVNGFEFFKTFIISQGWMNVLRYWRDKDYNYLVKLSKFSINAKKEIDLFLKKDACAFWLFEKELEKFLEKYYHKRKILYLLNNFRKNNLLSQNYSVKYLVKHYNDEDNVRRFEIVSHNSINLDSKYFIGIYVKKELINNILPKISFLLDKNIIIFDGVRKDYLYNLLNN
jgi:hypothetical protein